MYIEHRVIEKEVVREPVDGKYGQVYLKVEPNGNIFGPLLALPGAIEGLARGSTALVNNIEGRDIITTVHPPTKPLLVRVFSYISRNITLRLPPKVIFLFRKI